jgi:hypothetical protein
MKRFIVLVALILSLVFAPAVWGQGLCVPSGEQTATGAVVTGAVKLCGVLIYTDGANDATVILHDNTSAAGTKLIDMTVTSTENYGGIMFAEPIECKIGIYLSISGTNAATIIYYK